MALFKILRGSSENFTTDLTQSNVSPAFHDGHCYFIVDTGLFYVDYENGGNKYRIPLNAGDAKTILGATLEHDVLRDSEVEIPSSALLYAVKNAIEESVSSLEARKVNKITGLPNQLVGFDDEGNFIAKDSAQSNWNQNDETAPDYVKNRPFYKTYNIDKLILEERSFDFVNGEGNRYAVDMSDIKNINGETVRRIIDVNKSYIINFDGNEYECISRFIKDVTCIGNATIMDMAADEDFPNNEPFFIYIAGSWLLFVINGNAGTHTLSIMEGTRNITKIPAEYLTNADWSVNDESNPAYIKNRPFYTNGIVEVTHFENTNVTFKQNGNYYCSDDGFIINFDPTSDKEYNVIWDGVEYTNLKSSQINNRTYTIGALNPDYINTSMPFCILMMLSTASPTSIDTYNVDTQNVEQYHFVIYANSASTHNVKITSMEEDVHTIDPKFLPEGYPYKELNYGTLLDYSGIPFEEGYTIILSPFGKIVVGQKYTVIWDGVEYSELVAFNNEGYPSIGASYRNTNDDMPFYISTSIRPQTGDTMLILYTHSDATTHDVTIIGPAEVIHTIDTEYLPANLQDPVGMTTGGGEIFNDYENNEATGTYSHAEGNQTTASGHYSHAEGRRTVAYGSGSHTEGQFTKAYGFSSHAEGDSTSAYGSNSHAEGEATIAYGSASHAEGDETLAFGRYSHSEGGTASFNIRAGGEANSTTYTLSKQYSNLFAGCVIDHNNICAKILSYDPSTLTITLDKTLDSSSSIVADDTFLHVRYGGLATGHYSHSENDGTLAAGDNSHAEGNNTIAQTKSQHTQGEYNIVDTEGSVSTRGAYAHIVGNGTSKSNRSNAHTLDWEGNAWFAGDVYVGSTSGKNKDEGSVKLATMDDLLNGARDAILLNDKENGYSYYIEMRNGQLTFRCKTISLEVTTMPTITTYVDGELFDPSGMVITATAQDGTVSIVTDYTFDKNVNINSNYVNVYYDKMSVSIPITVTAFNPEVKLIDFEYTDNGDGTYTITSWKETLNGEASTEMIIPNNAKIIV